MRRRRSGTLWLAAMLVVLVAAGAYAQECPAPTVGAPTATTGQAAPGAMGVQAQPGTTAVVQPAPTAMAVQNAALMEYANLWSRGRAETVTGRIVIVDRFYPAGRDGGAGLEITIAPGFAEYDMVPDWQRQTMVAPMITVQLGPEWVVAQSLPPLKTGQLVTVTGVPGTWHNRQVLLAEEIRVGPTMVALRGPTGLPMWAGGWQAWRAGTTVAAMSMFNPATVETVSGRVRDIRTGELVSGMGRSTLVTLDMSNGKRLLVDLAPAAFLQQTGLQLRTGQQVTVTGSLVTVHGQQALLATSLQAAGQQYTLRSATGAPMWTVAAMAPAGETTIVAQAAPGAAGTPEQPPMPTTGPQEGMQSY